MNKFLNKLSAVKEQQSEETSSTSDEKKVENDDDDDDPNDKTWMTRQLHCDEKAPVLAKDASTKGDDWFEIYDPRNPINKRRRGEGTDKSKKKRT